MEQQQELNVSWSVIDGQPYIQMHITEDRMTPETLHQLHRRLFAIAEQIDYYLAPFIGAGAVGGRARKLHILRKEDVERDQQAARPLCAKSHEWGITFPLDSDPGLVNTCRACYRIALQELGGTWPSRRQGEQESEAPV